MHATTEQLISYRDSLDRGTPLDATVKLHVQDCEQCLAEVSQLNLLRNDLQAIPMPELSEGELSASWEAIVTGLSQQKHATKKTRTPYWYAVAASVLVLTFSVALSLSTKDELLEPEVQLVESTPDPSTNSSIISSSANDTELAQLVAYSRLLENRLQSMPQPRVVRANTAGTISELEDQISMLDNRLNLDYQMPLTEEQRNALWQQRVSSMNNLYRVRSAQLQRVSY